MISIRGFGTINSVRVVHEIIDELTLESEWVVEVGYVGSLSSDWKRIKTFKHKAPAEELKGKYERLIDEARTG